MYIYSVSRENLQSYMKQTQRTTLVNHKKRPTSAYCPMWDLIPHIIITLQPTTITPFLTMVKYGTGLS